jgi:hypothetical protein
MNFFPFDPSTELILQNQLVSRKKLFLESYKCEKSQDAETAGKLKHLWEKFRHNTKDSSQLASDFQADTAKHK